MYWGASLEFQIPLYFIPKDVGLKAAVFADAGSVWDYKGPTFYSATGETMLFADDKTDPLVGRRRPDLGFAIRSDAVRLFVPDHQRRLRQGAAIPFRRRHQILIAAAERSAIVRRMTEPLFFKPKAGMTVGEIAELTGAAPRGPVDIGRAIRALAPVDRAGPYDLTFFDNVQYASGLRACRAGACLISERFAAEAPASLPLLVTRDPYRAFVAAARALFPDALRPSSLFDAEGVAPGAYIHPSARLEGGVTVDPGAVVGPHAEIGSGTVIGAGAVIGAEREDRARLHHRPQGIDRPCVDRRSRHHPCRLLHRPGRVRLFDGPEGAPQGAAGRPRHHPGRRRNRRRDGDRPRRDPRYGDWRGHQDRQSRPDRPQRFDRAPLHHRRPVRDRRQCRRSAISSLLGARSGASTITRPSVKVPRLRPRVWRTASCLPVGAMAGCRPNRLSNGSGR